MKRNEMKQKFGVRRITEMTKRLNVNMCSFLLLLFLSSFFPPNVHSENTEHVTKFQSLTWKPFHVRENINSGGSKAFNETSTIEISTKDGKSLLRIQKSNNLGIAYCKSNDLKYKGGNIQVSAEIKTKDILSDGKMPWHKAVFSVYFMDNKKSNETHIDVAVLDGSSDWLSFSKAISAPQGTAYVSLRLTLYNCTGEVLMKNISIGFVSKAAIQTRHMKMGEGDVYPVLCLKKKIKIDGDPSDWPIDIPKIKIESSSSWIAYIDGAYDGPTDISSEVKMAYDEDALFIHFTVYDNVHNQEYIGGDIWKGDSIQLAFDTEKKGTKSPGAYEYGLALTASGAQVWAWQSYLQTTTGTLQEAVKSNVKREKGVTLYELSIPWSSLKPFNRNKDKFMGCSFLINDNDGRGREGYLEWSPGIGHEKDSSKYKKIAFIDREKPSCAFSFLSGKSSFFKSPSPLDIYLISLTSDSCDANVRINNRPALNFSLGASKNIAHSICKLDASCMKEGENILDVSLKLKTGELINRCYSMYYMPEKKIFASIAREKEETKRLQAILNYLFKRAKKSSCELPGTKAAGKISELFTCWFNEDLAQKKLNMENQKDKSSIEAIKASYMNAMNLPYEAELGQKKLNNILKDAIHKQEYALLNRLSSNYTPPEVKGLKIIKSSFYNSRNRPVFLFGATFGWAFGENSKCTAENLSALGFNIQETIPLIHPPKYVKGTFERDYNDFRHLASIAEKNNYILDGMLGAFLIPSWLKKQNPEMLVPNNHFFDADPDNPEVRKTVKKLLSYFFKDAGNSVNQYFLDLINEPGFQSFTCFTEKGFHNYLKDKYTTIENLNKCCKTKYNDFSEIKPFSCKKKIMRREWILFNQIRVLDYFKSLYSFIKKNSKSSTFVHSKFMSCEFWLGPELSHSRRNYNDTNWEEIAKLFDVFGYDAGYESPSKDFAYVWWAEPVYLDFCNSVAGNKPGYNAEAHFPENPAILKTNMWLCHFHGRRATTAWWLWRGLWRYNAGEVNEIACNSSLGRNPEMLWAYSNAAIELQKNAKYITPFAEAKRSVALFYSNTSVDLDYINYFKSATNVYQALSFCGIPIAFTTENSSLDTLTNYKTIIVPSSKYIPEKALSALKAYAKKGGKLIVAPGSFEMDEYGNKMNSQAMPASKALPSDDLKQIHAYLRNEIYKTCPLRKVEVYGSGDGKTWPFGIESQECNIDDKVYVYLINLSKNPVNLKLSSSIASFKNILDGSDIETGQTFALQPLDVVFLKEK